MNVLIGDLRAETADLERFLGPSAWEVPTPAEGWTVRDQISHLAWFDEAATRAVTTPEAFRAELREVLAQGLDTDVLVAERRSMPGEEVLKWFREARRRMIEALAAADPKVRIPWYGPDMGLVSFTTARLMETWAHGQDVVDGLAAAGRDVPSRDAAGLDAAGLDTAGRDATGPTGSGSSGMAGREPTDRLRHVAEIGVRTRPWSFTAHGRAVPDVPVRVELTLPGGDLWTAGPPGAADVVCGTALDFCLVVTQRRHPGDVSLAVSGPVAREWIGIAQAFAGPPGAGRRPGQFV
jgi:uncharacterized protein (TIGR03083 family)